MGALEAGITFEQRIRAADDLYDSLLRTDTRRFLPVALVAAIAIHLALAVLPVPEGSASRAPAPRDVVPAPGIVHAVVPFSTAFRRTMVAPAAQAASHAAASVPSGPEATPSAPPVPVEPVAEADPEMEAGPLPREAEAFLAMPEPPPAGPTPDDAGEVTNPVLIPESRVQPIYPMRAKEMGIAGNVVLDVNVLPDGTVGQVTALRCSPPDQGFCESASRAVRRWHYRPGFRGDRPAQVGIRVVVDFRP